MVQRFSQPRITATAVPVLVFTLAPFVWRHNGRLGTALRVPGKIAHAIQTRTLIRSRIAKRARFQERPRQGLLAKNFAFSTGNPRN
jgi:hypothetical protein